MDRQELSELIYKVRKLDANKLLKNDETETIISALLKSHDEKEEPYCEFVYHDEYGRTKKYLATPIKIDYEAMGGITVEVREYRMCIRRYLNGDDETIKEERKGIK